MTVPPPGAADTTPQVNAGRLWAGGLATAVVAALVALVGILLARGVFDVAVLAPKGEGAWGDADTWTYALLAGLAALLATGLMHLLILFAPRPIRFFRWILTLATLAAVIAPIAVNRSGPGIATALINLALGITVGTLVSGVARSATSPGPRWGTHPPPSR
jgi:Family of unknown function (DUF6069)